jgi:oxygen-independent coproporphyrinogen-3 oxidase
MAGIYIHIPFCKQRCTYCDFYTEVAPQFIPKFIDSLINEIALRQEYLQNEVINTIYFGGGTPSVLSIEQFSLIFKTISSNFTVDINAEITLEANPDDLTVEFIKSLRKLPFNRLSIGIQSFDDVDLKRINRRHTAKQAIEAVRNAQKVGFDNISIDLIYGLPYQTLKSWENQLDVALNLNIQHISAYGLTYEVGTKLYKQRENKEIETVNDDTMNEMYLLLVNKTKESGFEAYEISNFARLNFRSRHNSAYWKQQPYIGVGPSAHSYNISSRQWNVSSISEYIDAIENGLTLFELEELTLNDKYNDYIMVSLRTAEGVDVNFIKKNFGSEYASFCLQNSQSFIDNNLITFIDSKFSLTTDGIMISNQIIMQLMKV